MARRTKIKRVALALPIGVPYIEQIARGVLDYALEHGHWRLATSPESPVLTLAGLQGWPGDGVIALVDTPADVKLLKSLRVHAVNISGALENSAVPRVTVDNCAVGRMAAEHLLQCGLRNFGYYGVKELHFARLREIAFRETVERAGCACDVFLTTHTLRKRFAWSEADEPLLAWLKSLTLPVGIFACSDCRARLIIDGCRELGLRVPEDVAVLGVDNDQIACELCEPPLSSVSRNSEQVGREAAALLDSLMAGKAAPAREILIPSDCVVRRRSTDVLAIADPEVASAVRYMHEHLCETISIENLAQHQGVSRRSLEHAFQRELRRSPYLYLNSLRVWRASQLLIEKPEMTFREIARTCGFSDAKRFRAAFVRLVGITPDEYRRIHYRKVHRN